MEAYLDNSATTKVYDEVTDLMVEVMRIDYGNPSAMHLKGVDAENYIKTAAKQVSDVLKVDSKEILFTSGGTESNNLAIIGTAMANRRAGNHIITTSVEHASVLQTMAFLENQGFEVTYLPVNKQGVIDLKDLEDAITENTILVSVMYVNNEVGSVMPVKEIGELVKSKNKNIICHVDAIQAFGKYEIHPRKLKIDLLSVSGHKIHGPKGVGFLYIKDKTKINPIIFGGGQQKNMRSGTENVPGIVGIGKATEMIYNGLEDKINHLYELKDYMIDELKKIENVKVHSSKGKNVAPQIVNVSFIGVRSEVLLHSLEMKNVFVSAGSACNNNKNARSNTLKQMGCSTEEVESAIRFSFQLDTTKEEIDYALDTIREMLPKLRLFTRK